MFFLIQPGFKTLQPSEKQEKIWKPTKICAIRNQMSTDTSLLDQRILFESFSTKTMWLSIGTKSKFWRKNQPNERRQWQRAKRLNQAKTWTFILKAWICYRTSKKQGIVISSRNSKKFIVSGERIMAIRFQVCPTHKSKSSKRKSAIKYLGSIRISYGSTYTMSSHSTNWLLTSTTTLTRTS